MRLLLLFVALAATVAACEAVPSSRSSLAIPRAVSTATPTPRPVQFPGDDAPHSDLTEWWYYTGHLKAADGGDYGFEMVVFQSVRGSGPVGYAAHFAVTDVRNGRFAYDQRTSIGSQIGRSDGFDLAVGDWRMTGSGGRDQLSARMEGYAIELALESEKPPALHNNAGVISFGPAGDSYYYSRTRLAVTGKLNDQPVTGVAWMDHQWGNFISVGGGWDWFSVHFDDRTELTGSIVRDDAGNALLVYGTFVEADGRTRHLDRFDATPLGTWTSPRTGTTYPSGWRVRAGDLDVVLTPVLQDQELDTRPTTGQVYWEGAVTATGSRTGRGYVELTGYTRK
jgi:predicted secreted hydrolase